MTALLLLAAGMALGQAQAEPVENRRENIAQLFAESIQFKPNFCAKRDPEAEEAFMAFVRTTAFDTALRLLPRDDVLDRPYDPRWVTDQPLTLAYKDEVLAEYRIKLRCLRILHRLATSNWVVGPVDVAGMELTYGRTRESQQVPVFVDAYFEHMVEGLEGFVQPHHVLEEFRQNLDRARVWVAANLDSPLPEDAHTRLTSADFDSVLAELRETLEANQTESERNAGIDIVSLDERAGRQFVGVAPFFLGRRYLEMAWEVGLVQVLPGDALEHRVMELSGDRAMARRSMMLSLEELIDCEALGEGQRQFYREELQRLMERPY